ncbi:MAG: DUF542 domain-containing protein [Thermoguttaceae bacterium]|jgi:regulator of cell morphogenesis and NO signaling
MAPLINGKTTVRDLVGRYARTRNVFEQNGIDYCCGGGATLAQAAQAKQMELGDLIAALQAALAAPATTTPHCVVDAPRLCGLQAALDDAATTQASDDTDWYATPLDELVQHILRTHHAYLKKALPMLSEMLQKVLRAHGAQHGPMVSQLQAVFSELDKELSGHLIKEEEILFPYIVAAEAHRLSGAARPSACFPSVGNPIRQMEAEHESAGQALAQIHAITNGYTPPADVCSTFHALYEELQHLEQDLHQHIHLENNILFPRAIRAESESAAGLVKLGAVAPA